MPVKHRADASLPLSVLHVTNPAIRGKPAPVPRKTLYMALCCECQYCGLSTRMRTRVASWARCRQSFCCTQQGSTRVLSTDRCERELSQA